MTQSQEAYMKRLSVLAVLSAIALMANGASAQPNRSHIGKTSNAYGYARHAAPHYRPSGDRYDHVFESDSQGHQWFPNPDRALPSIQFGPGS
jgi:hypothetical protein